LAVNAACLVPSGAMPQIPPVNITAVRRLAGLPVAGLPHNTSSSVTAVQQRSPMGRRAADIEHITVKMVLDDGSRSEEHGEQTTQQGDQHSDGQTVEHGETRVIAYLMLFTVAWNMTVLRFVCWKDPCIRQIASQMVCIAVAVFCAVLINQAMFGFVFECLFQRETHGLDSNESGWKKVAECLVGFLIFFVYLGLLNYGCWLSRFNPNNLRAVATIGHWCTHCGMVRH